MKFLFRSSRFFLLLIAGLMLFSKNAKGQQPAQLTEPVKIGLLVQDSNSEAAKNGAELAIRKANGSGGLNGHPFQLLVRDLSGPWGTGSKQAVSLIFDEKVWVLLGSHDGRNAHLVEQAATKSQVVLVSVWAADPTLSQAFVPWFFNGTHNDDQQAAVMAEEICSNSTNYKAAIVSDDSYDSGSSLKSFLEKAKRCKTAPLQLSWESCGKNPGIVAGKLVENGINAVIIFCRPKTTYILFHQVSLQNIRLSFFTPFSALNEDELSFDELREYNDKIVVPCGNIDAGKMKSFAMEYRKVFGRDPGAVAASAYDGMNLLIEAIRKAGSPDREKIQNTLKKTSYEGITGTIGFDERGNRNDRIHLVNVKEGLPSGTYH